jgi:hypothetical protein
MLRPQNCRQRFGWQCQANDRDGSWTDYSPQDAFLLEGAWEEQQGIAHEISITLSTWEGYVFYLGNRLQQYNPATGRSRAMRRIAILEQGRPGGWDRPRMRTSPEGENEGSQDSEAF